MRFDTEEDYNPRYGPVSFQHFVEADTLVCEDPRIIKDNLWHGEKISLREVANNLDGDDRYDTPWEDRVCFGEMVRLAVIAVMVDYLEEPHPRPPGYEALFERVDYEELLDEFEESINYLMDVCEPKVSSYLFGRNYEREVNSGNEDVMSVFWTASQEVIFLVMSCLKYSIYEVLDLFDILYTTEGYLSGRWENDHLSLYLHAEGEKPFPERFRI